MKNNQEHKRENVTRELLVAALRNLPKVPIPASLRARLFGTIPESASSSSAARPGISLRKTWAGAAAVVFVCALVLVINYGSSIFPNRLITEANVASANNNIVDHNSTYIVDINRAGLVNQ
ncbi:MAG: hypothetical protein JXN61_13540 [Sedimentisphaerales bacterium]|nr:hypothetical protein [Sedimentisphaerales bacterium]